MLAVRIDEAGGPDALQVVDIPDAVAAPEEVLVRFEASTINPADLKIRDARIRPRAGEYPYTLGWDLVGRVVSGDGFAAGSRVAGLSTMASTGHGTWSELVAMPLTSLASVPDDVDPTHLAQLPLVGQTALQAVTDLGANAMDDVLVIGAGGAVGSIVTQLLLAAGVRPRALVRDISAVDPILATLGIEIVDSVPDGGAKFIVDAAGLDSAKLLAPGGRYIAVVPTTEPKLLPEGATLAVVRVAPSGARLAWLIEHLKSGTIRLGTPEIYRLEDVARAFEAFERRGPRIVLTAREER